MSEKADAVAAELTEFVAGDVVALNPAACTPVWMLKSGSLYGITLSDSDYFLNGGKIVVSEAPAQNEVWNHMKVCTRKCYFPSGWSWWVPLTLLRLAPNSEETDGAP